MITLIHGNNTAASRTYFANQKKDAKDPITVTSEGFTIADFTQILEGQALFTQSQQIFIEELFSKKKAGKEQTSLLEYIATHAKDHTIFIWDSKELTPKQVNSFKDAHVKKFDLPKSLFVFLDSLQPHNGKKMIELFHQTLVTEDAEFLFFMVIRQVRILLALIESSDEQIDEVTRLASWQKGKLIQQAQRFGEEKLLTLHSQLFAIESGLKTGILPQTLTATIDFLLLNL